MYIDYLSDMPIKYLPEVKLKGITLATRHTNERSLNREPIRSWNILMQKLRVCVRTEHCSVDLTLVNCEPITAIDVIH